MHRPSKTCPSPLSRTTASRTIGRPPIATSLAGLLCVASFAGCSSPEYSELSALRSVDVHGGGGVSPVSVLDELPRANAWPPASEETSNETPISKSTLRVLTVSPEFAWSLLGNRFGTVGRVCSTEEADRVIGEFESLTQIAPHESAVTLTSGQHGYLAVLNQVAFIHSFDLEAVESASVLDPVVDTTNTGIRVDLVADFVNSAGPWDLDVSLDMTDLAHPLPEVEVDFPGGAHIPITVQTPVYRNVSLTTHATLSDGETLILSGPSVDDSDDVVIAFLTPSAHDGNEPLLNGVFSPELPSMFSGPRSTSGVATEEDPASLMTRPR